jgi:hypothetical protein
VCLGDRLGDGLVVSGDRVPPLGGPRPLDLQLDGPRDVVDRGRVDASVDDPLSWMQHQDRLFVRTALAGLVADGIEKPAPSATVCRGGR